MLTDAEKQALKDQGLSDADIAAIEATRKAAAEKGSGGGDGDKGGKGGQGGDDDDLGDLAGLDAKTLARMVRDGRKESAKHRTKLREIQEAEAERERKAQEEKGEFKTLYEQEKAEREKTATTLKQYQERESASLTEALDGLTDEQRELIPGQLSAGEQLAFIGKLRKAGVIGDGGKGPERRPAGGSGEVTSKADLTTDQDRAAFIRKHGAAKYNALPAKAPGA